LGMVPGIGLWGRQQIGILALQWNVARPQDGRAQCALDWLGQNGLLVDTVSRARISDTHGSSLTAACVTWHRLSWLKVALRKGSDRSTATNSEQEQ